MLLALARVVILKTPPPPPHIHTQVQSLYINILNETLWRNKLSNVSPIYDSLIPRIRSQN